MNRKIAATGIAKWLVHRYPKAWRERYASEMLALLDDSATRWRDLIDLMHGLLVERLHSVFEPGSRPKLTFALLFAAPMVLVWYRYSSRSDWARRRAPCLERFPGGECPPAECFLCSRCWRGGSDG